MWESQQAVSACCRAVVWCPSRTRSGQSQGLLCLHGLCKSSGQCDRLQPYILLGPQVVSEEMQTDCMGCLADSVQRERKCQGLPCDTFLRSPSSSWMAPSSALMSRLGSGWSGSLVGIMETVTVCSWSW